jgi:sec-independent protein translocase protein TatA
MHLGTQELILILLIVIVLFGGKKVAGLGKALGTSLREFRAEVRKDDEPSSGQSETPQTESQRTETQRTETPQTKSDESAGTAAKEEEAASHRSST